MHFLYKQDLVSNKATNPDGHLAIAGQVKEQLPLVLQTLLHTHLQVEEEAGVGGWRHRVAGRGGGGVVGLMVLYW